MVDCFEMDVFAWATGLGVVRFGRTCTAPNQVATEKPSAGRAWRGKARGVCSHPHQALGWFGSSHAHHPESGGARETICGSHLEGAGQGACVHTPPSLGLHRIPPPNDASPVVLARKPESIRLWLSATCGNFSMGTRRRPNMCRAWGNGETWYGKSFVGAIVAALIGANRLQIGSGREDGTGRLDWLQNGLRGRQSPQASAAGRAPRRNSDFVSFWYRISDLASQNSYTKMPRSRNSDLVEPMEPMEPMGPIPRPLFV